MALTASIFDMQYELINAQKRLPRRLLQTSASTGTTPWP